MLDNVVSLDSVSIVQSGEKGTDMSGKYRTFSIDRLREALSYDPEVGVFTWKIDLGKMHTKGREAGSPKPTGRAHILHRYIRLDNVDMQAARIAWAMHYGAWPAGKLRFKDGDPLNIRVGNLEQQNTVEGEFDLTDRDQRLAYRKAHRQLYRDQYRAADLRKTFGISLAEYAALAATQGNRCAICGRVETETRNGRVKALAVDHDHESGQVRGLLCVACNTGIGKFGDDPKRLRTAAEYIEQHAAKVQPIKAESA